MRTNLLAAVAAVALTVVPGIPAGAAPPDLAGHDCDYTWVSDATAPGHHTGYIKGGPLVVAYLPSVAPAVDWDLFGNPIEATLACTIQVDEPTYAGPDTVSVSASGTTVVAFPPTPISFEADFPDEWVYYCLELVATNARDETQHLYWDYVEGAFSTSDTARCSDGVCTQQGPFGDCPDGPGEEFDNDFFLPLIDAALGLVEQAACLPLAALFPPEGDVPDVWDCPPYGS